MDLLPRRELLRPRPLLARDAHDATHLLGGSKLRLDYNRRSRELAAARADPNIDAGAATYACASGRNTPCYWACYTHNHNCVRILRALGAAPNHRKRDCTCPHGTH